MYEDIWAKEGRRNRGVEQTTKREDLRLTLLTKYHSGDQIKNKVRRACAMYGREERFWWEELRRRDYLDE